MKRWRAFGLLSYLPIAFLLALGALAFAQSSLSISGYAGGPPFAIAGPHQFVGGAPPALTSCGTAPVINGSDMAMQVTPGATATACTITFATAWNKPPICSVDAQSVLASFTVSATAVTLTATLPNIVHYIMCMGQPGG